MVQSLSTGSPLNHEPQRNRMCPQATPMSQTCPYNALSAQTPASNALKCPFARASVEACSTSDSPESSPGWIGVSGTSHPSSGQFVHQAWQLKRPVLHHDPKLTRRQLRRMGRTWSLADVAQHKYCDDGWIAVDGKVYDITEHIANHPGWDSGCRVSEVLSIIAHLGCDCSEEFHEIHRSYPVSYKQLAAFYIGDLQA